VSRAAAFKRAYRYYWYLSNQKEAFVKTLVESWGFIVRSVGLGALSNRYVNASGSKPDFAIYHPDGDLLAYVEVTGGYNIDHSEYEIWITYDKFRKYYKLRREIPIYFVYLGFNENKLSLALWCEYEDLYPYSEKRENIKKIKIRGLEETFIVTPRTLWKPLKKLYHELISSI